MQHETSFLHLTTWNFSELHDWCCFITLQACRLQMICIHIIAYCDNGINTIQKLCFCYTLFFCFFWRGDCSECIFTETTWWHSIGLLLEYLFQTCTSQSWEYFELYTVETRMAIFICSIYVKYYGNAVSVSEVPLSIMPNICVVHVCTSRFCLPICKEQWVDKR